MNGKEKKTGPEKGDCLPAVKGKGSLLVEGNTWSIHKHFGAPREQRGVVSESIPLVLM